MANYLLLYTGGDMPATDEEGAIILQAWTAWYNELGAAVVDPGNPFTPMAKSIASDGSVSDGPLGILASGYSIVKADSLDQAVGMAKGCPILKARGKLSVYETFEIM